MLLHRRSVISVLLLGFWALVALPGPATPSSHLVLGLAAVAAALLVVLAAAGVPVLAPPPAVRRVTAGRRPGVRPLPRLMDPDAAGRPRPRAPSACPAA